MEPRRLPAILLLVVAMILVAGCAGAQRGGPAGSPTPGSANGSATPGCAPERPAVAHQQGAPVAADSGSAAYPCLSKIPYNSREPTLGISSRGTSFFYPAMTGDNTKPTGVAVRAAGATSWTLRLPDIAGQPTHVASVDPYLYLDPATDRIFADDLVTTNCSVFSWSDDEGRTWQNSYSGCLETDHQTIFAGRAVSSTTMGYPNVLYRCAINLVANGGPTSQASTCQRSLDGGRTWLEPGTPAYMPSPERLPQMCDGALGHGATDKEGRVYLPKADCGGPWLAISSDEGITWKKVRPSTMGGNEHEAGVYVDQKGTIYYLWIAPDRLPYLVTSTDGGTTWTKPVMVGAPGVNEASLPELIGGAPGRLAFVYMGSTNAPSTPSGDYSHTTWNGYFGYTLDAGNETPTFHTTTVNDPVRDSFVVGQCCGGVQDFLDVRIGPTGMPAAAFVDACLGDGSDCIQSDEALRTHRVGAYAWLEGAPSFWDASDPNGPYPH